MRRRLTGTPKPETPSSCTTSPPPSPSAALLPGARRVDDHVRQTPLLLQRHLRLDPLSGVILIAPVPLALPFDLVFRVARHADRCGAQPLQLCLEQKRAVQDNDRTHGQEAAQDLAKELDRYGQMGRMVKLREKDPVAEHEVRELLPVDGLLAARVGREDAPSEGPDDPPVPPVPGFRGLARDRVEVDDREAFFPKGRRDGGLPAGDAAREAHDVHRREPPGSPPGSKCCAR
eukprot:CAMPEP_0198463336 /NCGR_PEP_ID=MMETSP1456-20131121/1684_1 /TAXON_ID=1461544 ORGANISM="Unidentified sp., Strain RCC1871" /NCGR_SAMPLE_ID=MMETSP1456 /ASSEMBLY_ACC=CAM_ASM_001119 /LENGTH=231 /DNA_ID=CAMNT_0044188781 /DNA_START=788 /DNA_END=1480 /DNA_ORIENTATION=-